MVESKVHDPVRWSQYEDETAQHIRDILGEELDLWLEGEVESRKKEESDWKTVPTVKRD